ncbi:hypothetical protein Q5424_19590 [Conexibacter sp. JD483]|uniref:hypothetical protein n=1 Tax=unclassified Conexibacter TaxID=2627773 RepID=UPI002727EFB4|nr:MULTISPECIES: hypothetical protein [unclassified Conexibacter]MDO8187071.1 hypothetical protein [Conexibacter sp. CPCC 205706]MDO8200929.1 hypothetical protein [Conexibacter sp. CPCC 205762]MDR9371311.1 hypothetical protein [Conexibacter sp. JD483]
MHPDWLGSPQHFVGGAFAAALAIVVAARLGVRGRLLLAVLGLGVAMTAETVVELAEYAFRIAHATAYYDTIADLAATLAGALAGAVAAAFAVSARRAGAR